MNKRLRREFMDYTDDYNEEDYLSPEDFEQELELRNYRKSLRNKYKNKRKSCIMGDEDCFRTESIDSDLEELDSLYDNEQISSSEYDTRFCEIIDTVAEEVAYNLPDIDTLLDMFINETTFDPYDESLSDDEFDDFIRSEIEEELKSLNNQYNSNSISEYFDDIASEALELYRNSQKSVTDEYIQDRVDEIYNIDYEYDNETGVYYAKRKG